jgi:D-apionolactonase
MARSGGRPVAVSPISLRPRFNPDEPGAPAPPGDADPRQLSLFGACWTLATMRALAEEGASATTWFETTGPRGVIDGGPARPAGGPSPARPGLVFPVYHVLRDLCELRGARLLACSGDPLRAAAVAVRWGDRAAVLVANLRPQPSAVELRLPRPLLARGATVRRLNTGTAAAAMLTAGSFRRQAEAHPVARTSLRLDLLPYEYTRLDLGSGGAKDG